MKPSKPPRDIKSFKSTEFIVDSDEDSAEEPVVDNTDSDDTEKSSIDSPSASKPKTKSTVVTETRPKGNPLQPSIDPNPISSSAKKAIKEKITIRSSSESQSRENESKEKPGKSSGEIRDDSESRGKSESESDAESSNSVIPETSRQPSTAKQVIPFKPPVGFKPASITRSPPPILTNILSSSSIRRKQLWHITIPASIPTNSIKDVFTRSLTTGAPILSHEGSDYGLISEPLSETFKSALLLPSQGSNQYEFTNLEVSKTLHLQQLIRIPIIANERNTLTNGDAKKYIKPVRQQPEGLRMRYRPFGDYSESSGESSSEAFPKKQPQTAHFRVPLGIETELEIDKKKIDDNASHAVRKKEKRSAKSKESARPEAKYSTSLLDGKTYPSNKRPEVSSLSFEEKTSEKSPRRLSQLTQSSAPQSTKTRKKITSEQSPQRLSQLNQSSAPQSIKTRQEINSEKYPPKLSQLTQSSAPQAIKTPQKITSEQSPQRLSQLTPPSAPLSVKTPQKIKKRKHIDNSPSVQTNTLSPIKSHKDPYADSESAPNARSDTKQINTDSSQPKKKRKKNKLLSDV